MKINTATQTQQLKTQVTVKEQKEDLTLPKEQVNLGKQEEIPDFLKKPETAALGCGLLGATMAAGISGTIHGIGGMCNALVGWAAQAIGGPVGGAVATAGLTGYSLYKNLLADQDPSGIKSYFGIKDTGMKRGVKAVLNASTTAVATYLGATFGPAGVIYGGLAKGGTYALVKGAKWGVIGASAGAATSTVAGATDVLQRTAGELKKLDGQSLKDMGDQIEKGLQENPEAAKALFEELEKLEKESKKQ